ncbi:diaminopimelate epimerase [Rubrobacter tropicus]|uniref:Diaminopimelate epimerase n=1 Tax=Rubrobacter tropicus TaxID=2653851 RepID=A0A6G8QEF8_9ACTN|nr:diaminopimelate epimerase [Rubrobacter tropicus]QIN84869.1 diaminopimelate epimerase [Rubrobacter tropicus]
MRFTKMHGAGNDFLIFDPGEVQEADLPTLARRSCDRHFGVGADGILVPVPTPDADLEMVYLNSDGSYSEMCGNGLRCLARYARDYEIVESDALTVATGAGIKKVILFEDGSSRVDMGPPSFAQEVEAGGFRLLRVSMGNPHAVAFLQDPGDLEALDLRDIGPPLERDPLFPEGTNVEFVHVRGGHAVRMRIWERGAGETLASGSGSCAAAVAAIKLGLAESPVKVHLDGGVVEIAWSKEGEPVYMTGPAEYVCEGELVSISAGQHFS